MKKSKSSRREFLKQSSMGTLGLVSMGIGSISNKSFTNTNKNIDATNKMYGFQHVNVVKNLAGMSLEKLRDRYKYQLFDYYLPNMNKYAIDHKYGGVYHDVDQVTGKLHSTNKTSWWVARGMWVYSFIYNNFKSDPKILEVARKSKDILMKNKPKDDKFWVAEFNRQGKPISSGEGDIYGSIFVAEGLIEYAEATGEEKYRKQAKNILLTCLKRYDSPDYNYYNIYWRRANGPHVKGPRVIGHWMMFLSVTTQYLRHGPDKELKKLNDRCIDAILNHHTDPENGLVLAVLKHDLTRFKKGPYSQLCIVGHDMETFEDMMYEAVRRNDSNLFSKAAQGLKRHVKVAADPVYYGLFTELKNIDKYQWVLGKAAWNQEEPLNGLMFLIAHTGSKWAIRRWSNLYHYFYTNYYDPQNKFWYTGGDRKMEKKDHDHLEHYHRARNMMFAIKNLNTLIDNKGEIAGMSPTFKSW